MVGEKESAVKSVHLNGQKKEDEGRQHKKNNKVLEKRLWNKDNRGYSYYTYYTLRKVKMGGGIKETVNAEDLEQRNTSALLLGWAGLWWGAMRNVFDNKKAVKLTLLQTSSFD